MFLFIGLVMLIVQGVLMFNRCSLLVIVHLVIFVCDIILEILWYACRRVCS